ncbi:hypothetical protein [Alkaliphilus pronyensis]|nr:hypothetical protein [Alkaliphilus pronyensis]
MSKDVEKYSVDREFSNDGVLLEEIIKEILKQKIDGEIYAS